MNENRAWRLGRQLVRVYATVDPRSLAAGRIALALVLLFDLVRRSASMGTWYTNDGLLPNYTLLSRPTFEWVLSFFYMASLPHEAAIGFLLCACSYLALLFGFWTRAAHIASFLCVLSLHGRVLFIDNGGDVALGELCLWTMFLPMGRRYSLDALRGRSEHGASEVPDTTPVVSLAVTALFLQLAVIYLFNAMSKTGPTWREGSAVHYVLHQSRIVTATGIWAREHLSFGILQALARAALGLEWGIAVLLLLPYGLPYTRRAAIAAIWVLHLGFALFLNLGLFVPAMLAYTPNLLSAEDWNALEAWWAKRKRRVPATTVRRACKWLARFARRPASYPHARVVPEVLVGLTMLVAGNQLLAENVPVMRHVRVPTPLATRMAVSYLQLFEAWSMFAPDAPTSNVNVYFDAVTADGRHVDPVSERASPRHPAPGATIPDRLETDLYFCDYLIRIAHHPDYHQALTNWILRYPERTGREGDRIVAFEGFLVEQDSPRPGETSPRNHRTTSFIKWPRR